MGILDRVNQTAIEGSLLVEANAAHANLSQDDRQDMTATGLAFIKMLHNKQLSDKRRRDLLLAIQFRLEALARLEVQQHTELGGWIIPSLEAGMVFANQELFEVAAIEPLVEINNEVHFIPESFFSRLLALSKAKGSA